MNENFNTNAENDQNNSNAEKEIKSAAAEQHTDNPDSNVRNFDPGTGYKGDDINRFSLDEKGNLHNEGQGTTAAAIAAPKARTYIILGWVSTAFTAFISPLFAIAGIIFGVLANRKEKGRGNAVIITNIVLAAVNILFGYFLIDVARRMIYRY
jgi:hypothetical protein